MRGLTADKYKISTDKAIEFESCSSDNEVRSSVLKHKGHGTIQSFHEWQVTTSGEAISIGTTVAVAESEATLGSFGASP